jgi:hypothetical protein
VSFTIIWKSFPEYKEAHKFLDMNLEDYVKFRRENTFDSVAEKYKYSELKDKKMLYEELIKKKNKLEEEEEEERSFEPQNFVKHRLPQIRKSLRAESKRFQSNPGLFKEAQKFHRNEKKKEKRMDQLLDKELDDLLKLRVSIKKSRKVILARKISNRTKKRVVNNKKE